MNPQHYEPDENPITFIIRGTGVFCNLKCKYCFFFPEDQSTQRQMPYPILEKFTKEYLEGFNDNTFVWHGGEPLSAGLKFYQQAMQLQKEYRFPGNKINNQIQTNLTLVTEEWAKFFKENNFHIGGSLDGPEHVHDMLRKNRGGKGSFKKAISGYKTLQKEGLRPGIIAVVTKQTLPYLEDVLNFFYFELGAK